MEYLVVCDVNVYIDAVGYLADAGEFPKRDRPGKVNARRDAALVFDWIINPPPETSIVLFSDELLDRITVYKLLQAREDGGKGWTQHQVTQWLERTLLAELDATGRSYQVEPAAGEEYLARADHEDRRVYGLFKASMSREPYRSPILVSRDREFVAEVNDDAPRSIFENSRLWLAVSPSRFCEIMGD